MTAFYEFKTSIPKLNNDRTEIYRSTSSKHIEKKFLMLSNIVMYPKQKFSDTALFRKFQSYNKKHSIRLNKKNHKIILICTKNCLIKLSRLFLVEVK